MVLMPDTGIGVRGSSSTCRTLKFLKTDSLLSEHVSVQKLVLPSVSAGTSCRAEPWLPALVLNLC